MNINTDYPCNPDNYKRGREQPVSFLVYHYVGAEGSALQNAKYFNTHKNVNASAHYFVGNKTENGAIYRCVKEEDTAWHVGANKYYHPTCRNANSIGIEMCCHLDENENWYIDEVTYEKAAELGKDIMMRYNIPMENVLRHYDVTHKQCPKPLIDEAKWADFKKRLEDDMVYYRTINDIPESYRPSIQKLVDSGYLKGYGYGVLSVSEDFCRIITILDRIGVLDMRK